MQFRYLTNQLSQEKFNNVAREILDDNFSKYFPNLIPMHHHRRADSVHNVDDISSELDSETATTMDDAEDDFFDIPADNVDMEQELMSPRGTKRSLSRGSMLTDFYERLSDTKIPRIDESQIGVRNSPMLQNYPPLD